MPITGGDDKTVYSQFPSLITVAVDGCRHIGLSVLSTSPISPPCLRMQQHSSSELHTRTQRSAKFTWRKCQENTTDTMQTIIPAASCPSWSRLCSSCCDVGTSIFYFVLVCLLESQIWSSQKSFWTKRLPNLSLPPLRHRTSQQKHWQFHYLFSTQMKEKKNSN